MGSSRVGALRSRFGFQMKKGLYSCGFLVNAADVGMEEVVR